MRDPKARYLRDVNLKSKLSDAHKVLLDFDVPGWKSIANDERWSRRFTECVELKSTLGRLPTTTESPWLKKQRLDSSRGVLKAERKALLDEMLPGWSWSRRVKKTFSERLDECVEQANRLGRIPDSSKNRWLERQKAANVKGNLSQERIDQLDKALPGWSDVLRKSFSECLEECVSLVNNLGRLPKRSESSWLYLKKRDYRQGKLSDDNIRELDEKLPGWRDAFQ